MKFLVLILSLLAVMQATQIQEETELGWSAYCKRRVHKFAKNWWKIDRNRDGKIYWREMKSWAIRKGHGKYLKHYYKFWKKWAHGRGYVSAKYVWNRSARGSCPRV